MQQMYMQTETGDMNPNGQNLRREWHPHYLTLENQPRVIIAKSRNWKEKKTIDAIKNFKTLKLLNPPHLTQKDRNRVTVIHQTGSLGGETSRSRREEMNAPKPRYRNRDPFFLTCDEAREGKKLNRELWCAIRQRLLLDE